MGHMHASGAHVQNQHDTNLALFRHQLSDTGRRSSDAQRASAQIAICVGRAYSRRRRDRHRSANSQSVQDARAGKTSQRCSRQNKSLTQLFGDRHVAPETAAQITFAYSLESE